MNSHLQGVVPADASADGRPVGRVSRVHRGAVDVLTPVGERRAEISAAAQVAAAHDPSLHLCVGDLVTLDDSGGVLRTHQLLPRRTAVTRASVAPGSSHRQVLAANVDLLAVVEPLDRPALGRIERLLAVAWESGATPVVVLTKSDLAADAERWAADAEAAAPGVEVHLVSPRTGDGMAAFATLTRPGEVTALLGPSGAGKSTLVNALSGELLMDTAETRSDGRGRHTTAHRELVMLPDGAMVIDTPGLRSIGLAATASLEQAFADIEEWARQCRFGDCAHDTEPGCAVLDARDRGVLSERRLASWRKLQREAAWQQRRGDARLAAEERARWKARAKQYRAATRSRP